MKTSFIGRMLRAFGGLALAVSVTGAAAQTSGAPPAGASCVVTAGNRNAPLAVDGTYTVFGIPGNLGAIRARATCSDGSIGQSAVGFTNPFEVDTIPLGRIIFGHIDPVPIAANLSAAERYLNTGETSQLHLLAVAADGSSHDATPRSTGTVYSISNALMATVSDDGLVTIYPQFASGSSARVVASATTEGSVSSTYMYILGPRGSLTGKVVRADGSTTVAGAQISVLRLQPMEQAGTSVTQLAGTFAMNDVNAGTFLISVIDPTTGDRALGTARIETEGQSVDVTLRLTGQGRVDVTVVDASDTPVANAGVTWTALGANRDTRTLNTNAEGIASFVAVPAGLFTVSTRDPLTRLVGTAVANVAVEQNLPVRLRLQPIGQVQGVVYNVDGSTLLEGVQVRILSRERGIVSQNVTAVDGAFAFDTLPISDGPFTLDAFVDGRLRARVPGIVIDQANDTVTRNVVLGAVGTVEGNVRDPSGSIFANARVTMQSLAGLRLSFDALSNASGHFVLPAVPVGDFELTAVTPEGRSGRAQGRVDSDGAVVILDVVMADNTLVGTVFQRDGVTPVSAGITVYLAPRSRGRFYSYAGVYVPPPGNAGILRTLTDAQGRFGFNVPGADSYYIQAEQDLERGRSEIVIVNLDPSQPLESRIVFLAKGVVSGSVRDSSGTLQGDVAVTVHSQGAFIAERNTRTDAQGHYALDGVFAGDIVAVARNELTQLAGAASGRLDNEAQLVTLDVTLAATGTLSGRVLRRDGSVVDAPVRLVLKRNRVQVATLDVPDGQSYQFNLVPLGDLQIDAEELGNGDKGVSTTRLASAGEHKNLDVRLVGQGSLRLHVVDQAANPVAGVRITVSTQRPFVSSRELLSDTNGDALFEHISAGDFSVSASKLAPLGSLNGSASGTLLPSQEQPVNIVMTALAVGRVHGRVFRPDGVTPVGAGMVVRMLPEPFVDAYVTQTDAQGDYSFQPVEAGSYNVDALNFYTPAGCPISDRVRGRATGVAIAQAGDDVQANIQLIGQGQVFGTITDAQGNPAAGIEVRMTNADPVYGFNVTCSARTTYDRITDAQGNYVIEDAPPGDFSLTAENFERTRRAEGRGQVRFDGDAVVVDMSLIDSAVTMPQTFYDANGFPFDITGNGSIGNGHLDVFAGIAPDNGAMRLELVSNGVPVPFTNGDGSIGRIGQGGQQVEVDDVTPSGLTVTRRVYTPRAGYFTRYLELLRNDTELAISVDVRVKSHHRAANSNPRVVDSSDGDQILSVANPAAPDRWVVVDDQLDADPFTSGSIAATGHLFDGVGATLGVATASYDLIGQTGRLSYAWNNVTVAPGQTVALMHFAFNQLDRYSAREAALRLAQLPPEAIDDLTTDERHAVLNFEVPESSALEPLPNLDAGLVHGRVLSGDGVTPIDGARVRFKSQHVLFGRDRFVTSNANGEFRYRSTLDGTINNYVIPVHAFELIAVHPRSAATTALTPGDFDAGQTQEEQDLIFVNRGDVRGSVKRHNAALVEGAYIKLCRFDNPSRCTDDVPNPMNYATSASDGRYLMTANGPRDYFLFANKVHPQSVHSGRDLLGRATATVTAGDTAVADIFLEATGSISGVVRSADGTPVVNALVELALNVSVQSGGGTNVRATRSDTAGHYRLFDVPLGSHRLTGTDAISLAQGMADAMVTVDHDTEQDITLRGFGEITAHVKFARGVPAPNAPVTTSGHAGVATDTNGVARFQLPEGPHTLIALHPDSNTPALLGQATAIITHSGEQVDVTITLQPAGSVHGSIVRPDATTLAGGFPYNVNQIRGNGAGRRSGRTDQTGDFRVAGLPIGGYLITAYDAQQDRFIDAEFDIAQDGEEVLLDLVLLENRIALPATLLDANRFSFDVQHSGAIKYGNGAFSDAGVQLSINGQAYAGDSSARLEANRRQFAITQPGTLSGLTVSRKVYVPRGAYFARYIEVLENHTGAGIIADVELVSQFAGGGVLSTSTGDTTVNAADRWVVVDDQFDEDVALYPDQMPAASQVFAGASGVGAPDSAAVVTVNGKPRLSQRWNTLSVPAGGRVSLLHFTAQQINRRGALAAAERLQELPPEVLVDLSEADIASIHNFTIPGDLSSSQEPLPAMTASVSGIAYEGDVRTPVLGARITVQSDHPLFNRVWGKRGDPVVCPVGTPVVSLVSVSTLAGGTQNPPPLGSYVLQGQLTADDSIALPEGVDVRVTAQEARSCYAYHAGHPFTRYPSRVTTVPASATQDVIYDTGILTGSVVGDANFSMTNGRVYRSIDNPNLPFPVYVPIAADATYVYPGLPPGDYDLLFDAPAPNATVQDEGLRGSRTHVQVSLGQITVTDLSMQPTGSIDGVVVTANGEPSRNAQLTLRGEPSGQLYDQCAADCAPDVLAMHIGKRRVERLVQTDSLGRYKFIAVPNGAYTLTAIDPISGGRRSVELNVVGGAASVPITLLAVGSANLQVLSASGNPVVDAFVYLKPGAAVEEVAGRTNELGRLTVANIPQGSYSLRVRDPRYSNTAFMDRRASDSIDAGGEQDNLTINLLAAATLAVSVIDGDDGNAAVAGATITVSDDGGTRVVGSTNALGRFDINPVVQGAYTVKARVRIGDLDREAVVSGTIDVADDQQTRSVQIDLRSLLIALPVNVYDANRYNYRINVDASGDILPQLRLDDIPFTGAATALQQLSKRQYSITQATPIAGLKVTRQVFVPRNGYFARIVEIIENPGTTAISVDARLTTQISRYWSVRSTSSGDNVLDSTGPTPDRWFSVGSGTDSNEAWAFVSSAEGGTSPVPQLTYSYDSSVGAYFATATWPNLSVAAGQRVVLMHFAVRQHNTPSAIAAAQRLSQIPPEVLDGLDVTTMPQIVNFPMPLDGQSTLPPLPPLEGNVSGRVLEGDGITPVVGANVTVQSAHALFNRAWSGGAIATLTTDAQGHFSLSGALREDSMSIAIALDAPLALSVTHPASPLGATATAEFAEEATTVEQDLQFESGLLHGAVTGAWQYVAPYSGSVRAYRGPTLHGSTSINSDGSYMLGGLAAGVDRLEAYFSVRNGSAIRGDVAAVTVVAGQSTQQNIGLQDNGAVVARVLTSAGTPAIGQTVSLSGSGLSRSCQTDAQGRCTLGAVPIGSHSLSTTDSRTGSQVSAAAVVAANQTTTLDLQLPGLGTVTITTRFARGALAPNVAVYAMSPSIDGMRYLGATRGDATLTTQLAVGPYTIRAKHPLTNVTVDTAGSVAVDGELSSIAVVLKASANLHVRVLDADAANSPIVNASVKYKPAGATNWKETAQTGVDGSVTFNKVSEGTYELSAQASDGRAITGSVVIAAGDDNQVVEQTLEVTTSVDQTGTLGFVGESHLYGIEATAGDAIAVGIRGVPVGQLSGNCAIRAQIYAPNRQLLASGYGFGPSNNFAQYNEFADLRNVPAATTGFYVVAISAYNASCHEGGYRLSLARNASPAVPLAYVGGGAVSGHLYLVDGSTAVADGKVRLSTSAAPKLHVETTTDVDGSFLFERVPLGQINLLSLPLAGSTVQATGSAQLQQSGTTVVKDLIIPGSTILNIQAMRADGTPYDEPVSFSVSGGVGGISTWTDEHGHYVYTYVGVKAALVTMHDPDVWSQSGEAVVPIADGQTVDVNVRIGAASLEGTVSDSEGMPLPNLYVTAIRAATGASIKGGYSDAQGHYYFDNLPGGAVVDVAVHDSQTSVQVKERIQLVAGQTVQQDVHMPAHGNVHGTIRHAWGRSIDSAEVVVDYVVDDASGAVTQRYTNSDADGAYHFDNMPVGRPIQVRASKYVGNSNYAAEGAVSLTNANRDGLLDLTLDIPGGTIEVNIGVADGRTAGGYCQIDVAGVSGFTSEAYYVACGDPQVFDGVPAGLATVSAYIFPGSGGGESRPVPPPGGEGGGNSVFIGSVQVTVVDSQSVNARISMSVVKGVVSQFDGTPVAYPSMSLIDALGNLAPDSDTNQAGEYRFEGVQVGDVVVRAEDNNSGLSVSQNATITDPEVPLILDMVMPATGNIQGVVKTIAGDPVPDATTYASSTDFAFDRSTQTDAQGQYHFDHIALGEVSVSALHPENMNVASGNSSLVSDGQNAVLNLVFPQTGAVGGFVTQPGGGQAAESCVDLWSSTGGGAYADIYLSTMTDETGRYDFPTAVPGPVVVQAANCSGPLVGLGSTEVSSGQPSELDVPLGNAEALSVSLTDSLSGYRYEIEGAGDLNASNADTYGNQPFAYGSLGLRVGNANYTYQPAARTAQAGREVIFETNLLSGLRVTRRVYVPAADGYARILDSLSNLTAAAISVSVQISGTHADQAPLLVVAPASVANRYAMQAPHNPEDDYMAAVSAYVFAGIGSTATPATNFSNHQAAFGWSWNVTVQPGQTASYLNYAVIRLPDQGTAAQAQAEQLSNMTQAGMFDGLSPTDRTNIQNFAVPQ